MKFFDFLLGKKSKVEEVKRCETCSRSLVVLGLSGRGGIMLTRDEFTGDVGAAEQCWECGRVYCDACYPNRNRNTCICGQGRKALREIDGVVYRGSLRLVKVRYITADRYSYAPSNSPGPHAKTAEENLQRRAQNILASVDASAFGIGFSIESAAGEFAALGEPALDVLLTSVSEVNMALFRAETPELNMDKLRLRVAMLAAFKDERAIKPILQALVDSSEAVRVLTSQFRDMPPQIKRSGGVMREKLISQAENKIHVAERLQEQCMSALVSLGEMALAHLERSIPTIPRYLQQPFLAVKAAILKH